MSEPIYQVGLNKENDVLVDWKRDLRYVVLTPEQALEFAAYLTKHAKSSPKYKPS